jgi:single stranded DNA-binding protein
MQRDPFDLTQLQHQEETSSITMASISFSGNIGKYHGLKYNNEGKARASFSAAETPREKNQQGEWVDGATTWFNVTLFGRDAEALDAAIPEGKGKVLVSGRMKTRKYEHNGEARESLDVVADSVGLIPRSDSKGAGQQPAAAASDPWATPAAANSGGWGTAPAESDPPF